MGFFSSIRKFFASPKTEAEQIQEAASEAAEGQQSAAGEQQSAAGPESPSGQQPPAPATEKPAPTGKASVPPRADVPQTGVPQASVPPKPAQQSVYTPPPVSPAKVPPPAAPQKASPAPAAKAQAQPSTSPAKAQPLAPAAKAPLPVSAPASIPSQAPARAPGAAHTPAPASAAATGAAAGPSLTPEQTAMTLALRQAEPRLSAWLAVVLDGVTKADELLWERVRFLLQSLEAPQEEINAFIKKFRLWLDDMEYERLADFRSELQYRLALALDLEDEEDERSRLMIKLSEGLAKTREQIARNLNNLFLSGRAIDAAFWEELEEILIMADVGFETAHGLTERLRRRAQAEGINDAAALRDAMRLELLDVFKPVRRISVINPPEVILVIGVNGVGKTTTIAKLCHRAVLQGKKVLLVAGDTFRAAATEQLEIWAKRAGAGFYAKGHGADPAAVAYEAVDIALAEGYDTVFVDTAGRLHTKTNLMEELVKVSRVLGKRHPGAPHRTLLILDSTTGQNGLSQVKLFNQACGIDELILTKLDGTAKGGIAVAAAMQFGIPISFIGLGEKMEDLRPFDAQSYVAALLDLEPSAS